MKKIAVIGAGTWGIALSLLLHDNGHKVAMWAWKEEEASELRNTRENSNLKGIHIPEDIEISSNINGIMSNKDIILVVVPSVAMRDTLNQIAQHIKENQIIVIASKGIEESTFMTMTDIANEIMPDIDVAAISGPSHAEEVAIKIPTSCVITTKRKAIAKELQDVFMNDFFRVYISPDMIGVELGGALKNIIALAAGIADGLELGDNTKAALMTRGLHEMTKIGMAMGADQRTFFGLTGVGDLIVTCGSMHSRNRRMGILLGKGYSVDEAMNEVKMVVEGVYATKAGYKLAHKFNIDVPIVEAVYKVLFEGCSAKEMVNHLMQRGKKEEIQDDMENINTVNWE